MIYNAVKLPLLRFYISTQPKSVPSEESDDDDHGRADCVSEPDDEPDNEPDDEQSVDRSYRQDSTDEPHDVLTDSSVTRENLASWSQGIRTLVIRDPMAFSVGKNYAIFEDDPDSEINCNFGLAPLKQLQRNDRGIFWPWNCQYLPIKLAPPLRSYKNTVIFFLLMLGWKAVMTKWVGDEPPSTHLWKSLIADYISLERLRFGFSG